MSTYVTADLSFDAPEGAVDQTLNVFYARDPARHVAHFTISREPRSAQSLFEQVDALTASLARALRAELIEKRTATIGHLRAIEVALASRSPTSHDAPASYHRQAIIEWFGTLLVVTATSTLRTRARCDAAMAALLATLRFRKPNARVAAARASVDAAPARVHLNEADLDLPAGYDAAAMTLLAVKHKGRTLKLYVSRSPARDLSLEALVARQVNHARRSLAELTLFGSEHGRLDGEPSVAVALEHATPEGVSYHRFMSVLSGDELVTLGVSAPSAAQTGADDLFAHVTRTAALRRPASAA